MNDLRHIAITLAAVILLGFSGEIRSQHYMGISVAGHVPMVFDKTEMTHVTPSYGAGVGFSYEWHKDRFFLHTGAHYRFDCPAAGIDSLFLEQEMVDTEGVPFTYRGVLKDRTDHIRVGQLAVPLYAGFEWEGIYVMAGVTAVLFLHNSTLQKALLQTVGDYGNRYYEWIENVPSHGYHDFLSVQTSGTASLSPFDLRVGGEAGYTFRLKTRYNDPPVRIRLGAFAEYGVFSLTNKSDGIPMTLPDYSQYMQVTMTNIYCSSVGDSANPHMFLCGIRATFLFPVSNTRHCMCNN